MIFANSDLIKTVSNNYFKLNINTINTSQIYVLNVQFKRTGFLKMSQHNRDRNRVWHNHVLAIITVFLESSLLTKFSQIQFR